MLPNQHSPQTDGVPSLGKAAVDGYKLGQGISRMLTMIPGIALGVVTADCAPVAFAGLNADGAPVIGTAHAGWQGALGGILEATLEGLEALGAAPGTIRATIGPCIAQKSYEVDQGFYGRFLDRDTEYERFFKPGRDPGHYQFDLAGFCAARLAAAGISDIHITGADTYSGADLYFSYRRATHNKEPDYGRQISVIAIAK